MIKSKIFFFWSLSANWNENEDIGYRFKVKSFFVSFRYFCRKCMTFCNLRELLQNYHLNNHQHDLGKTVFPPKLFLLPGYVRCRPTYRILII